MLAKTIMVSDDVYELLKKMKLPGESFSDVIRRSILRGSRLMDIAGTRTITKEEWGLVEAAAEGIKLADEEKRRKLLDAIRG